jgi:RNA polymerase sigma-70 factor, ECF subfamily
MVTTHSAPAGLKQDSDAQLLRRMQAGDDKALGLLMNKYGSYVYRVIANVLLTSGTPSDAEELTSDTFYAVWNHAGTIDARNLKAYLAVTARNKAKSFLRKHRELPMDLDTLPLSNGLSLEDHALEQELKAVLHRAIDKMRPQDRDIFLRYYYYMQTTSQISQLLNIPHSTVRTWLMRGRKTLQKMLIKEGLV